MTYPSFCALLATGLFTALSPAYGTGSPYPRVVRVGPVAPDILAIEIQAGRMEPIKQVPYEKQPGDRIEQNVSKKTGEPRSVTLIRDGKAIGFLVGRDRRTLSLFETLTGEPLDDRAADRTESYKITSPDDGNYEAGVAPATVWRKTKSNDWADSGPYHTSRHYLYLKLPHALKTGKRYSVAVKFNVEPSLVEYLHKPEAVRSEAVHASQIGFRPEDPGKSAFLSIWLGTGGAYAYPRGLKFQLRDDASGKAVYTGNVVQDWNRAEPEQVGLKVNNIKTDVYRMDFGDFRTSGKYRVCVETVGCSYPFEIASDVWLKAFRLSMKGAYHHRSGIELGPPYTEYRRPRPFHQADGVKVYQSTCPLMYSGNGLNVLGTEHNNFDCLVNGKTDQVVEDAWGGYMDAGDWDRRIQHLEATRLHLELIDLRPDYFRRLDLNIPESRNELPDVIDEALFNLDCYRRLQVKEGGIRGGIESSEHPTAGETSWQESLTVMTYAPGIWESYVYAGVAARAAHVMRKAGSAQGAVYEESAVRAIRWAEAEYARWKQGPDFAKARKHAVKEIEAERNLAAVEVYRLTGDRKWHDLFVATQDGGTFGPDAAFVYARLDASKADPAIQAKAIEAIRNDADAAIRFAGGNAFRISLLGNAPHPYSGFYTVPAATSLVRAHALTGKPEYLEAIVRSTQFSAGANPMNMTMTTGMGYDYPRHLLHEDSRHSGQPVPVGITIYGPMDMAGYKEWATPRLNKECTPPAAEWPAAESYFDVYAWAAENEYTVMQTIGPAAYVWGYLAAR